MWQRFTEQARIVIFYSQEEAQRLGEGYVSTEHMLLGLLRTESTGTKALATAGFNALEIRVEVLRHLPKGDARPSQDMTLTPRAKRVIDLAYEEARLLGDNYIGTEHLLLGMVAEADGLAGKVLAKFGVNLEVARRAVLEMQKPERSAEKRPAPAEMPARTTPDVREPRSHQLASLLTIRQQLAPADYLALIILAERPSDLCDRLAQLDKPLPDIVSQIENEILQGPQFVPGQANICELIAGTSGVIALFQAIATHPSTFTRKAFEALGISQERLRDVLG